MTAKLYEDKISGIIRRYLDVQELDREIVEELIDHIEIGERSVIDGQRQQDIKIFYRFVGVVQWEKEKTRLHPQAGHTPDNIL